MGLLWVETAFLLRFKCRVYCFLFCSYSFSYPVVQLVKSKDNIKRLRLKMESKPAKDFEFDDGKVNTSYHKTVNGKIPVSCVALWYVLEWKCSIYIKHQQQVPCFGYAFQTFWAWPFIGRKNKFVESGLRFVSAMSWKLKFKYLYM